MTLELIPDRLEVALGPPKIAGFIPVGDAPDHPHERVFPAHAMKAKTLKLTHQGATPSTAAEVLHGSPQVKTTCVGCACGWRSVEAVEPRCVRVTADELPCRVPVSKEFPNNPHSDVGNTVKGRPCCRSQASKCSLAQQPSDFQRPAEVQPPCPKSSLPNPGRGQRAEVALPA